MTNYRTAGDERRALALIQHHHGADTDGLNAVLREAADAGRIGQLIVTVLDAYEELARALYAQPGRDALIEQLSNVVGGRFTVPVVAVDLSDDDLHRGARLILAHWRRDGAEVDSILFERDSITAVPMAAMSLYSLLAPALNTDTAMRLLRRAALRAAGLEAVEGE